MMKTHFFKPVFLMLALLILMVSPGCMDLFRGTTRLIEGTFDTPTPYITLMAHGTPHLHVTPYPQGTPVFDSEKCVTNEGQEYLFDAALIYYSFKELRRKANEAAREDLPPIIDEMRDVHGEFRILNPPSDCETLVELDYAYEAEVDQTIRAYVAFRNLELEDVWQDYFNEALFYNLRIQEFLNQSYY
jgi:hypothetical protein